MLLRTQDFCTHYTAVHHQRKECVAAICMRVYRCSLFLFVSPQSRPSDFYYLPLSCYRAAWLVCACTHHSVRPFVTHHQRTLRWITHFSWLATRTTDQANTFEHGVYDNNQRLDQSYFHTTFFVAPAPLGIWTYRSLSAATNTHS